MFWDGRLGSISNRISKIRIYCLIAKIIGTAIAAANLGFGIASFIAITLIYTYSHYCFASVTTRISAMYAAFIAVAAACGVPGLLVALAFRLLLPTARFLLLTTVTVAALFTSVPVKSLRANGGETVS